MNPTVTCNVTNGGNGINLINDNVTLINPHVISNDWEDCSRGILIDGANNLSIRFDPN